MFDWNDLRHFLAVARTGSTLAAGNALRVSQTTVARRITALEAALVSALASVPEAAEDIRALPMAVPELVAALSPLLAALCSLASLGWLGQPLTLFSLFGLLLVTAISVDSAILMREQIGGAAVSLLGTLLAALTTWLSFGLLAVSSTPAVSNFGLSVSLGLAFSFILAPWAGKQEHSQ